MAETVVLITGANQGLGFEIVKKLAAENDNYTILLGSRDLEKGQKAAAGLSMLAKNTQVEVLQIDVVSDQSIEEAAKEVEAKHGRVDVLLNNAGVSRAGQSSQREEMLAVYNINAVSLVMVSDAFLPLLKKSKAPRLMFMSSDLGSMGNTLNPEYAYYKLLNFPYKASKAAMNMVAAIYSVQLKEDGFRVNVVNPGFRRTNLNGYHEAAGDPAEGVIEPCRLITMGDAGETATYSELEGPIPW